MIPGELQCEAIAIPFPLLSQTRPEVRWTSNRTAYNQLEASAKCSAVPFNLLSNSIRHLLPLAAGQDPGPCGLSFHTKHKVVDPLSLVAYLWNMGIDIPTHLVENYWDHYREFGVTWATWSSATRVR